MVKLADIAGKRDLSLTTVSRALNGYPEVNRSTVERVRKTAREMGYVVNRSARSLALRKNHLVSLLVYESKRRVRPYQDFTFEVVAGIRTDDPCREELREEFIPAVFMDYPMLGSRTQWVESDNEKGCRLAIDHLVSRGHERIAFINGHHFAAVSATRLDGYRRALRKNGITFDRDLAAASTCTEESGYDATRRLPDARRDFTAIFAASDLIALGANRALTDAGRSVPRDVAVIGFDDIVLTEYTHPRLTTVRHDMFRIGREGAEELHRIMEQPAHGPVKRTVDVELVIRESA